ncbi:MAG: hypothetical protein ACSHYA_19820 [Opitutaceae bacterium]
MASQFFYAMNSGLWTAGPVDPFAAPGEYQTEVRDIARSYFRALAQHDVDLALAEVRNLEHLENQEYIYGVVAVQLAKSDPQRALAMCRELPPKVSAQFIGEVFQARMHQDFEAAKSELAILELETWPSRQQSIILNIMWEKEPVYAAEFLVQMNVPPALAYDIQRSLTELVDGGKFDTYMEVIDRLPPLDFGYDTGRFMGNIAQRWNAVDPEAARHY